MSGFVLTEPRDHRRRWFGAPLKFALGCLFVVLATGGATAVFILEQVHTVVQDLRVNKPLTVDRRVLAHTYYGGPETLLFVGDDWRPATKYYPNAVPHLANEMLLVRIDPSKPFISMMSIPRELWVPIATPAGEIGPTRLNAAYTFGTTYLVETIKQVTGVSVNHVIVATFGRFEQAINDLGCVYATVDERYYHNNADGGDQYQNIDLQPGYQCLNGSEAEQFVSYRHTDTSQIRDARDQAFLLAVKNQYGPQLADNVGKFERIFGRTVQTDPGLDSSTEILNLANLLISAAGRRVRQVPFAADPLPSGDLTATPQQIQQSVHNFLFGGTAPPTRQTAAIARKVGQRHALAGLPLTPTLASNVAAEKAATADIPFTAEFPKVQDLAGSGAYTVAPQCTTLAQACVRDYLIHAPGGKAYPIYVEVFSNGQLGQFYDVQGTTWTNAPLFADPNQTIRRGQAHLRPLLRRHPAGNGRLARVRRLVLGPQHPDRHARQWRAAGDRRADRPADAGDRRRRRGSRRRKDTSSPQSGAGRRADPNHHATPHEHCRDGRINRRGPRAARVAVVDGRAGPPPPPAPAAASRAARPREPARPLLAAAEAMRTTLVVPARPAPPAGPTRPTPPPTPASHVTVRAGSDTP